MPVTLDHKQKFARLLEIKRERAKLDKEAKEMKTAFTELAAELLPDGVGKVMILEDMGAGLVFATKKSGISATKLREAGVTEDVIEAATSSYIAMDVFSS